MIIWVLIVLVFVGALVFITINNSKSDISPAQEIGEEQNMENTQDGIKITILKEGDGEVAKAGDTVSMNYTGTLVDGTVFDSNIDPKFQHVEPFEFTLGVGQVIQGWDLGVDGMKVGEQRRLDISSEFAYGENGIGPIPPNSTLSFDVELLAIKK